MKCDTIEELERFLQIQVQALGKVSPEVAITLSKLANLYATNGNYAKAEILHNRALEIRLNVVGAHQSEVDDSRRSLERVRQLREKDERDRTSEGDSARTTKGTNGAHKDDTHGSRRPRPTIEDSIKEMELEVALLKQMVGIEHPAVADSLTKLADLYCKGKLYESMEPVLLEALRIREELHGAEHPNLSPELKNLAQLYYVQEKYQKAEPLFQRAITLRTKALGEAHPKVIDMQAQYAKLLRKTNRSNEADRLEESIKLVRRTTAKSALPT